MMQVQVTNTEQALRMREDKIEALRRALENARAEAFEYMQRMKHLESHLLMLCVHVIKGRYEEAEEVAYRALALFDQEEV